MHAINTFRGRKNNLKNKLTGQSNCEIVNSLKEIKID
jgi:hypothetical protein